MTKSDDYTIKCNCILENQPYGHKSIFSPVDESYTNALSRDTIHLRLDNQVCFYRQLFYDTVKPPGRISCPVWPLRGINRTTDSDGRHGLPCELCLGHLLMAQHCHMYLNVCFSLPTAPHLPPLPTPIDSIRDITAIRKITSKTRGIQRACRISYEILAI